MPGVNSPAFQLLDLGASIQVSSLFGSTLILKKHITQISYSNDLAYLVINLQDPLTDIYLLVADINMAGVADYCQLLNAWISEGI